MGPEGSSTVISWEEQKILGFGTADGPIPSLVVLGGVGVGSGASVAGLSEGLWNGHCRSTVLYCAMEKSQNRRGKEMVVGVYSKRDQNQ